MFLQSLFAQIEIEDINATAENNLTQVQPPVEVIQPKVLYLSYIYTPKRVIKGEVFKITLKTLPVIENFDDIIYNFSDGRDIKLLTEKPYREKDGRYFYDTFYFQATGLHVKIPNVIANILTNTDETYRPTTLLGKEIDTISLHPREDFCNIIAKDFLIKKYKTT
ncbi:MAG: hypothetical protein GXO11_00110, partial [Epsilonproteobacteria bacterium]|nr:hypothetical protein [Campylobacterota bacterium]